MKRVTNSQIAWDNIAALGWVGWLVLLIAAVWLCCHTPDQRRDLSLAGPPDAVLNTSDYPHSRIFTEGLGVVTVESGNSSLGPWYLVYVADLNGGAFSGPLLRCTRFSFKHVVELEPATKMTLCLYPF